MKFLIVKVFLIAKLVVASIGLSNAYANEPKEVVKSMAEALVDEDYDLFLEIAGASLVADPRFKDVSIEQGREAAEQVIPLIKQSGKILTHGVFSSEVCADMFEHIIWVAYAEDANMAMSFSFIKVSGVWRMAKYNLIAESSASDFIEGLSEKVISYC